MRKPSVSAAVASPRKTTAAPQRREDLVTRRESVDPALLRASRELEARRSLDHTWLVVRFVGAGFLLGALAVHAIASVRMARRIDVLNGKLEQVTQEQERWRVAATNVKARLGNMANTSAASRAPLTSSGDAPAGLVFPALDLAETPVAAAAAAVP